jgi:hypothetical protein
MKSEYVNSVITDTGKVYDFTKYCTSSICNFENIEISDLMVDDFKLSILYKVCLSGFILSLMVSLFQEKATGKIGNLIVKVTKLYIAFITLFIVYNMLNMKPRYCEIYHGCGIVENMVYETYYLRKSTYYYLLYDDYCPTPSELIYNYEKNHENFLSDDCGENGEECCKVDSMCNRFITEYKSALEFNNTLQLRDTEEHKKIYKETIHIKDIGECYNYDLDSLIYEYIKTDREYFKNMMIILTRMYFIIISLTFGISMVIIKCEKKEKKHEAVPVKESV